MVFQLYPFTLLHKAGIKRCKKMRLESYFNPNFSIIMVSFQVSLRLSFSV